MLYVSVPTESRLKKILVTPGQRIKQNDNLFELELSPTAALAVEQSEILSIAAQAALRQTQQKFDERLATNLELTQAKQAAETAAADIKQLRDMQTQSLGIHTSKFDGVVSKIDAQPGQIVPPSSPIVELVTDNGIEVELGVEIEDVRALSLKSTFKISAVLSNEPYDIDGKLRLAVETVDPQTRLTSVFVTLPPKSGFKLGESVKAVVDVNNPRGLVVPRQAVVPDGSTDTIFIVRDGRAVETKVRVSVDNGNEVQILSDEIKAGLQVVTVGNSQVTDGMRVQISGASDKSKADNAGSVPEAKP